MDGYVTIGTELDTKSFDRQISQVESELKELELRYKETQQMSAFKGQDEDLQDLGLQIEKTRNKLVSLNQQQQKMAQGPTQEIEQNYNRIGKSVDGVVKKVGKWALAVFGVRSAYNFVRQAISTLSGSNEQIATDIEYIRFALASTLQPIIEWLIQAVYKLLMLIGGIVQKIFGINIFANATTKAFNKSNKEIAKMRKQLAGFDEANVLGDNAKTAGGGAKTPSFDLSKLGDTNEIVNTITSIFNKIGEFIDGFFTRVRMKITKFLKELGAPGYFIKAIEHLIFGIGKALEGIIDIVKGIFQIITGIFTGNIDLFLQGIQSIFDGVVKVIQGILSVVISNLQLIFGPIFSVLGKMFDYWKSGFQSILNVVKTVWNGIKSVFSAIIAYVSGVFTNVWNIIKGVISKIAETFKSLKETFKTTLDSLWDIAKKPLNLLIDGINKLIKGLNKIKVEIPDWVPEIGGKGFGVNIPTIPRLAKGGIINMPGRGVAIGGESGREAVLPLTDSQQMALIGEAIGKYVTINANITNTMNGRVISRELQKINNENNFAYNR